MTTISSFINRLKRIGVNVELGCNIPWIYMTRVNGERVVGTLHANHGFTVFFKAIRVGEVDKITDIPLIFNKIRETLRK